MSDGWASYSLITAPELLKLNTIHIKVFPLGQTAVDTRVTHDLVGGFIVLLLDTHFPECIGVWTALFDPLGLGILVGPGRRNDSRGIYQEPKRKTSVRWCI